MGKAFVTHELLISISIVALFLGITLPILGAMRTGNISVFWGCVLIATVPLLWIFFRVRSWLDDRHLARRLKERDEEKVA